jgi:hypothetical protein
VAELVDARDLKSLGAKALCRFDSGRPHHKINHLSKNSGKVPKGRDKSRQAATGCASKFLDLRDMPRDRTASAGLLRIWDVKGALRPLGRSTLSGWPLIAQIFDNRNCARRVGKAGAEFLVAAG